jgi:hypothetical protein
MTENRWAERVAEALHGEGLCANYDIEHAARVIERSVPASLRASLNGCRERLQAEMGFRQVAEERAKILEAENAALRRFMCTCGQDVHQDWCQAVFQP